MSKVYAVATMDTKGHELEFVANRLRAAGVQTVMVDVGTLAAPQVQPDVDRATVSSGQWQPIDDTHDRGQAIAQMSRWLGDFLRERLCAGDLSGVIGIGGSGGTALITHAMRQLNIGIPKLMVSTVASGNVAPYIDCHDITMMYSVVDIAGLNSVSRRILANAAAAMAGMVQQSPLIAGDTRTAIGLTMFGVTTPCVNLVREQLEIDGYDALVFHATGAGGRAMEQLVAAGLIRGVLDITTTEVADEIVGGVFPAGPERFDRLLSARIPLVVSLGALDMVNFGALDTVPKEHRDRQLHVHNAQVTLMRTNEAENQAIGRWIAQKLNRSTSPVRIVIPERGLSLLDQLGGAFYDPQADQALFDALRNELKETPDRLIQSHPLAINDPAFAGHLLAAFNQLMASCAG